MTLLKRYAERVVSGLASITTLAITSTGTIGALSMLDEAPQFSAILFGASVIALAIWKRPVTEHKTTYHVGSMEVDQIDGVWLDRELSRLVLEAMTKAQLDAAAKTRKPS